jgi:hypothetical protein
MSTRNALATAVFVCVVLVGGRADAAQWIIREGDGRHYTRPMNLDAVGFVAPWSVGMGAHFAFSVVPEGFIRDLNDSFDIELSALVYYWYWRYYEYYALVPLGGVRWKFHLTPEWTVFGLAKIGFGPGLNENHILVGHEIGAGAYWHFSKDLAVRMEASSLGFSGGISLSL